ncbi:MAG: GNAT family N-acetyltransferase [Capnocytophaga sp.]|nr:GNAT family N-acetyltransferase [Capnocytophaga sp.]
MRKLSKATLDDFASVWDIILFAKETRRLEGSTQWQDGYPNEENIKNDIINQNAYVIRDKDTILAYAAIIFDKEEAYENIEGNWISNYEYTTIHRIAISEKAKGLGLGTIIMQESESISLQHNIRSIRIDTNYDNQPMLRILEKLGYTFCGYVYFRNSQRMAFEKVLV